MGFPLAAVGDSALGLCLHTYQSTTPSPGGPVPTPVPLPLPFVGKITGPGCSTVMVGGKPASVVGDKVANTAVHPPVAGGAIPGPAVPTATNTATIARGSATVMIGGKPAVRLNDITTTECGLAPGGGPAKVIAVSTVLVG